MMKIFTVVVVTLSLLVNVGAFARDPTTPRPAPEGWEDAKLRMTLAEFRRAFPTSEEGPALPGLSLDGRVRRQLVWKAPAQGLSRPVDLEFRFWEEKLWMILVYTNDTPRQELQSFLEARFGVPTLALEKPSWIWPRVKVVAEPRKGWFAIFDRELGQKVQAALHRVAEPWGNPPANR